jgi:WhiB family redox-sensing transcriptional regulator
VRNRRTFDPREARSTPPALSDERRACKGMDVEHFYPKHATGYARALAICHACQVEAACLAWAVETKQVFGVYGGTTPDQRHFMIENAGGEVA